MLAWWHSIILLMTTIAVVTFVETEATQTPCQISLLIPFRDDRSIEGSNTSRTVVTQANHSRDGATLLATALLAIQDWNNRTSLIAPAALDAIKNKDCQVFFPPPIITDSGYSEETVRAKQSSWLPNENSTCSIIIGPKDNLATQAVGELLNGTQTMAISYAATADELAADSGQYSNIALGTVKWENICLSLFQYLKAIGKDDVGILFSPQDDDFNSTDFVSTWTKVSRETGIGIYSLSSLENRSSAVFRERLVTLKEATSVETIVVTLHRDDGIEELAGVAAELGMLTDDYSWILMDAFVSPQYISNFQVAPSSAIAKLFDHSVLFQILDGFSPFFVHENGSDEIQIDWLSQSADLVDQMNSLLNETTGFESTRIDEDFFEKEFLFDVPAQGSSLIYDAIVAAGISLCNGEGNLLQSGSLFSVSFHGVSGEYKFEEESRSLQPDGLQFAVYSVSNEIDNAAVMMRFEAELMYISSNGDWNITQEIDRPILSEEARIVGFTLAGIALAFASFCSLFVFYYRKDRIVSIGQPEFLYLICFGSFLLALPIILKSFDEGHGWTIAMLNSSCTSQAWLKYLGILTVDMALFSKLYRVEKVTQIRRGRRVQVKDVIKPFLILIALLIVALIVWTILEPPEWRREEGQVGFCFEVRHFDIGMDIAMIFTISVTLYWARKTRDLPEDISDSGRVYQTLVAQFVLLMFEILFLVITLSLKDNDFAYITNAIIAFALSISSAAYLMVPKMYYVWRKNLTGEMPPSLQRGTVQVSGISVPIGVNGVSTTSRYGLGSNRNQRSSHFRRSGTESGSTIEIPPVAGSEPPHSKTSSTPSEGECQQSPTREELRPSTNAIDLWAGKAQSPGSTNGRASDTEEHSS